MHGQENDLNRRSTIFLIDSKFLLDVMKWLEKAEENFLKIRRDGRPLFPGKIGS